MNKPNFSAFDIQHHQEDLPSKIVVGLEKISELFRVLLWEKAKHHKLSPLQIQLLVFISFHRPEQNTVTQLAKEFHMSKATLSDALRVLRTKGYLHKNEGASDKRSHHLSLTKEGQKLVKDLAFFADPVVGLIGKWAKKEQETFYLSLLKLLASSQEKGLIHPQRMCYSCKYFQQKAGEAYCNFLKRPLKSHQIRVDCPEFASPNSG